MPEMDGLDQALTIWCLIHDQLREGILADPSMDDVIREEVLRQKVRDAIAKERSSLFERISASPLTSVIVAALLAAALTAYYDKQRLETEHLLIKQRAEEERVSARHELELAKTLEVYESISRLLDKRLWHLRRVIWLSDEDRPADLERERVAYAEAVEEWNVNLNRNLALIERYFGTKARRELEFEIAPSFKKLHEALYPRVLPLAQLEKEADALNERLHPFHRRLLDKTLRDAVTPRP